MFLKIPVTSVPYYSVRTYVQPVVIVNRFRKAAVVVMPVRPAVVSNVNNFSPTVTNNLSVNAVASGGSTVNVNVNQLTTITNSPKITPPLTVVKPAVVISPVYRGSNFVVPYSINADLNFATVVNRR